MKYKLSKNVFSGCAVRKRGNKYIVCGKKGKPCGIYVSAHTESTKIRTMDGKSVDIVKVFPEGVAYYGVVKLGIAK